MKIEIITSMSFDEYNERLYYESFKDEEKELTRRNFLKYLTIGCSGLLVPIYPEKEAQAVAPIVVGIFYLGVFVAGIAYGVKTFPEGEMPICGTKFDNKNNKESKIAIDCRVKNEDKDRLIYSDGGIIVVPPKTIYTANIETETIDNAGNYIAIVRDNTNEKNAKSDKFKMTT